MIGRHLFGSTFRRAFCNGPHPWVAKSARLESSFYLKNRTFRQHYTFEEEEGENLKYLLDDKQTGETEEVLPKLSVAEEAVLYDRLTSMSLSSLEEQFARDSLLAGKDELIAELALMKFYESKKKTLRDVLNGFEKEFERCQLKKDPDNREKLPCAVPYAEIECDRIARLKVEEPWIAFTDVFFLGEKKQKTGISSHSVLYTDNKGNPVTGLIGRKVNGCKTGVGPAYALERAISFAKERYFLKCRYFSSKKTTVKCIQDRMKKLKAGEKVSNDRFTKIAKSLIENGSTIEYIAKKDNRIAAFFAHMMAKIGDEYLDGLTHADGTPWEERPLSF